MIYTSYWGNLKELINQFGRENIVGVSRWSKFWNGKKCSMLFPSESLLRRYKNGEIGEEEYREEYLSYLNSLNVDNCYKVFNGCVFVCYEKEGFCHRHLIAEWLRSNGYDCIEFGEEIEEEKVDESVVEEEIEEEKVDESVVEEEIGEEKVDEVIEGDFQELPIDKIYIDIDEMIRFYKKKSFKIDKSEILKWLKKMNYGICRRRGEKGTLQLKLNI